METGFFYHALVLRFSTAHISHLSFQQLYWFLWAFRTDDLHSSQTICGYLCSEIEMYIWKAKNIDFISQLINLSILFINKLLLFTTFSLNICLKTADYHSHFVKSAYFVNSKLPIINDEFWQKIVFMHVGMTRVENHKWFKSWKKCCVRWHCLLYSSTKYIQLIFEIQYTDSCVRCG